MEDYILNHWSKKNLIIHIFAVPIFIISNISILYWIFQLNIIVILLSFWLIWFSLLLQWKWHKLETNKPKKFSSKWDFIKRIYIEQFITFPLFLISWNYFKNIIKKSEK